MSDVWLHPDMPPAIRIRPNRHHTVQQLSVAFTVVPSQDGALLARSTCQKRSCPSGPVLDVSPPQQSRHRELRLDNLLLHCRTARGLPHQLCSQLVSSVACESLCQFAARTPYIDRNSSPTASPSSGSLSPFSNSMHASRSMGAMKCALLMSKIAISSSSLSAPGTSSLTRRPNNTLKISYGGIALKSSCASKVSFVFARNSLPTSLHLTFGLSGPPLSVTTHLMGTTCYASALDI